LLRNFVAHATKAESPLRIILHTDESQQSSEAADLVKHVECQSSNLLFTILNLVLTMNLKLPISFWPLWTCFCWTQSWSDRNHHYKRQVLLNFPCKVWL